MPICINILVYILFSRKPFLIINTEVIETDNESAFAILKQCSDLLLIIIARYNELQENGRPFISEKQGSFFFGEAVQ
jgi:hypothetical protein